MRQSPKQHKIPKVKNWDGGSKQAVCINPGRASTGPDVLDTLKCKSDEKSILTRLDRLMDINTIKNFTFITFH